MAKKKRDFSQVALGVVEHLTGGKLVERPRTEPEKTTESERQKNPAAVALSKLGASKGGKARAEKLSPKRRKEIARNAAKSRWGKHLRHK